MPKNKQSAFTIVELLIVIVVIGILAALTMNSVANAQRQARNQQNISLASAYTKALNAYLIENGGYPAAWGPGNGWICLGKAKIDVNNDGKYDCVFEGATAILSENAALDAALKPYVDVKAQASPAVQMEPGGIRSNSGVQLWYDSSATLDGQPHYWYLYYNVEGQATCSYGNIISDIGWPQLSSTRPAGGYTYQNIGGRGCLFALPDPSKL